MGQTTRDNTKHIFRSLLALGVIELGANPIKRSDLIISLNNQNIRSHSQAKRLLELTKNWLTDDDAKFYSEDNGGDEKSMFVDFQNLPTDIYLDFIDTLLSLYKIGERRIDDSILEIYNKRGIKPLSLITQVILAIEDGQAIHLLLEDRNRMFIAPSALKREDNVWLVVGVRVGDPSTLKTTIPLHQINDIEF
ncbi:MAG: hypothetical protein HUU54_07385 [Ignavibacteriaceae bacterium]|nr:hypothetical protein [Ignavibacteriaceae bacterium]